MQFTNMWFEQEAKFNWELLLPVIQPKKVLEIGSFEGRSAVYMIQTLGRLYPFELHCVDSWDGVGLNYCSEDMNVIRRRFLDNTKEAWSSVPHTVKLVIHEEKSMTALPKLYADHKGSFDFIYVDGSHNVDDVLQDATHSFDLVRTGGVIGFDDYLWQDRSDPVRGRPGVAIDLFLKVFGGNLRRLPSSIGQVYVEKMV